LKEDQILCASGREEILDAVDGFYASRRQWIENQTRGVLPAQILNETCMFLNLS